MVGVPGKYKGCETCRRRRVKCSNERPFCQKCINSGRHCEGYERERVFITGTPESKGRVASHPRRSPTSSSSSRRAHYKSEPGATPDLSPESERGSDHGSERGSMAESSAGDRVDIRYLHDLTPTQPLRPAWDDYIALTAQRGEFLMLMTALQVPLHSIAVAAAGDTSSVGGIGDGFRIGLPPYSPPETPMTGTSFFNTNCRCLVHLGAQDVTADPTGSYCAFLFESTLGTPPDLGFPASHVCDIQRMGPQSFTSFPAHHFFSRVYRPMTVGAALLNRRGTFLSEPAWCMAPWEMHPKNDVDRLLDIVTCLPMFLEQLDHLVSIPATLERRQEAQNLLHDCLSLERRFNQWLEVANQGTPEQPLNYWVDVMASPHAGGPFSQPYAFKDAATGIMFLYYWMAQIQFHRCVESLYSVVFEPVVDAYPNMWATLPPALQGDWSRFQEAHVLAGQICRGLDAALETTAQPDLLAAPMAVALNLYRDMNVESQEGMLEILWLEGFRSRLVEKGRHVATVLQGNSWFEMARF